MLRLIFGITGQSTALHYKFDAHFKNPNLSDPMCNNTHINVFSPLTEII